MFGEHGKYQVFGSETTWVNEKYVLYVGAQVLCVEYFLQ